MTNFQDHKLPTPPPADDMSFEAAEWNLLRHNLEMTFDQRMNAVESMSVLAREFEKARVKMGGPSRKDIEAVAVESAEYQSGKSK